MADVQAGLRRAGADVKWVEPANLHLTLKFLGEVPPRGLDAVRESLARPALALPPFTLETAGAGTFPARGRPRVVWLGLTQPVEIARLHHLVEAELTPLGFASEERAFAVHVTLGRVRSPRGVERLQECLDTLQSAAPAVPPWRVNRYNLIESRLSSLGPSYLDVEEYALIGS